MHGDPAKAAGPREHDAHVLEENEAIAAIQHSWRDESERTERLDRHHLPPPTASQQQLTAARSAEPDGELELEDHELVCDEPDADESEPWADAPTSYYSRTGLDSPRAESIDADLAAHGGEDHAPAGAWSQHPELDAPPEVWPAAPNETSRGLKRRARRSSVPPALEAGPSQPRYAATGAARPAMTPRPIPSLRQQLSGPAAWPQVAAPRFAPLGAAPPQVGHGHASQPQRTAAARPPQHGAQRASLPPLSAGAGPRRSSSGRQPVPVWTAQHASIAHSLAEAVADASHHTETSFSATRSSGVHLRSPVREFTALPAPTPPASLYLDSLVPQVRPAEPLRRAKRPTPWLWNLLATLPLCAALAGLYMLWVRPSPATPALAHASAPSVPVAQPVTGFTIDSRPSGAEIRVDGTLLGAVTPARVTGIQPGLHSVELTLAGHLRASLPVQISEGAVFEVPAIELHPEQAQPAAQDVEAGAAPELSREQRRAARAERRAAWLAKREARKAKREARRGAVADVQEEPQAVAEAPADLPAEQPEAASAPEAELAAAMPQGDDGPGMLRINSRPWSKVFVDDRFVGNTPQLALELDPGRHSVRLVNEPLGMAKTLLITIRSGETVTKIENLIE